MKDRGTKSAEWFFFFEEKEHKAEQFLGQQNQLLILHSTVCFCCHLTPAVRAKWMESS